MRRSASQHPIKLAVSACLLGENVRYDGTEKYDAYIAQTLREHFELLPICPEVAIGLGVPRPPIHLIHRKTGVHAIGVDDPGIDVTQKLRNYGDQQAALAGSICGFIFKSRSPSCGVSDTPIDSDEGDRRGAGLFADRIIRAIPYLPVIDEVLLAADAARDNFLECVFSLARWQQLKRESLTIDTLHAFHLTHTAVLSAHDERSCSELSDYLSTLGGMVSEAAAHQYLLMFMKCLRTPVCNSPRIKIPDLSAAEHALRFTA